MFIVRIFSFGIQCSYMLTNAAIAALPSGDYKKENMMIKIYSEDADLNKD